ncbi:MAG: zinc ribbon domain-containing protein [Candidatus Thermoplasmatota archaeon]|nr:zinc ribbon domain-containing protein [Candidatus Thermoplasmatota archaeon]
MRVTGNEEACPQCGKEFGKGVKFKCPYCGALVSRRARRCPSCQVDLSEVPQKAKARPADVLMTELARDLVELEALDRGREEGAVSCPVCMSALDGTESECPKCGHSLAHEAEAKCPICGTPVYDGFAKCPMCGISLEKVGPKAEPPSPSGVGPEAATTGIVGTGGRKRLRPCPFCGAVVPESFERCPLCNTSFTGMGPREETSAPSIEPPEPLRTEGSAIVTDQIEAEATKSVKIRRLRIVKGTPSPYASLTNASGRTNGIGHTNGVKVRGAGAVNGKSFVNGTGVSETPASELAKASAKRTAFITRWQLLAVIVAVLIVIPVFIVLSRSDDDSRWSIDGDFSDWAGATTYGTLIQSSATTSNITEWAVGTQSSDLFFYFRTQAHMMSSPDPESYYLFVDSDGLNTTGYIVGSIGADHLLQLTGWDSAVRSTSLSTYISSSDQHNWNAWGSIGALSYSRELVRLEAGATLPDVLEESARFILVSKDASESGSVSCTAPLDGGVLVVRQAPAPEVAAGLIQRSASTAVLTLNFTCQGEGGQVTQINPSLVGAPLSYRESPFSLEMGEAREITVMVDTSTTTTGQLVSAKMLASGIVSTFASVEIVGSGASVYAGSAPSVVAVDGAFADWTDRLSFDQVDPTISRNVDIRAVGNVSTSQKSFFYVSVEGEICRGAFVPATVAKPSGVPGGGVVLPTRRTAEDILSIYVDSDRSSSTGEVVELAPTLIGADQKIEVKGLFGRITSMKEFDYSSSSGSWIESAEQVDAAKDDRRIEVSVSTLSLGGSVDIDFIVETTSWQGRCDLAVFDPSSMSASTRSWTVDSPTTSAYATSMSYQRKMLYDGVNLWSFFFNGTDTVHKYSVDDGWTWTLAGPVFTTPGVNETSIWYDPSASKVYAVGDTSSETTNVSIQVGTVDALAHTISWTAGDFSLQTSSYALAGKNTYVSKDANGYLWLLSSNRSQLVQSYQLSAFMSSEADSAASWVFSGQMLPTASITDNVKGSIVPAGSGSDVWAISAYAGNVAAVKYNGTWQPPQIVYAQAGSKLNTDNSPPSVVVDGKGVVHVVYGTGRKTVQTSIPTIEYSRNETGLTTFTAGINLDSLIPAGIGDFYPTISLDASTDDVYVLWLQSDATFAPKTVMGKKCISGTWYNMTVEAQTAFTKMYLTSVYSASNEFQLCWQWTQNETSPFEVIFDGTIPELGGLTLPLAGLMIMIAVYRSRSWGKEELTG